MVTCTVHAADGTQIGGPLAVNGGTWRERAGDDGLATSLTVDGATAAQLAESVIVRLADGSGHQFGFVPTVKTRKLLDAETLTSEVELTGPGVRWLLSAGQVYQEDLTDCALPAGSRWLGWMSDAFDDTSWTTPVDHGTWREQPFSSVRPEQWPAPTAQYLWRTTDFNLGEEDVLFRQTFTVAEDTETVLCITADDEFECWLDGTRLPLGTYGGEQLYNWKRFDEYPLRLCAGTHTFAVRGRNLPANVSGENPGWVLWAFCEVAGDGRPAAQNAIWKVVTDATGGTFTLRPLSSATAITVDYNETGTSLQTKLEGLVGVGNVQVSGAAGDWDIEFTGAYANVSESIHVANVDLTGGTVSATETQRGGSARIYAQSTTSTVVHHVPDLVEPGLTAGEILRLLLEEAQARGVSILDHVTLGFTDTTDSDGTAFGFGLTFELPLPDNIHRVVEIIEELGGYDVWMDADLTLQVSQERGDDLALTLEPQTTSCANAVATSDETQVANVIRLRPDEGWSEVEDDDSVTARGRWESDLIFDEYRTRRGAAGAARVLLNDVATPQRTTRFEVPSGSPTVPHVDYGIGDRPMGPVFSTSGFESSRVRVDTIEGQIVEGDVDWTVEVVD